MVVTAEDRVGEDEEAMVGVGEDEEAMAGVGEDEGGITVGTVGV